MKSAHLAVLLAALVSLLAGQTIKAQEHIYGRVIDAKQMPLTGVSCVLLSYPDSTRIAATTSNEEGRFELSVKEDKQYILQLSFIGYKKQSLVCQPTNLGDIVMSEDSQVLGEVVVTPQILNTFGNRDQLTLSETAKKVGNNALDAISSLPQFRIDISSDNLLTVDNKSILVLIDGMRRSARELKLLKADDIKSIQFYSNPPTRYAHENIGAVIDVRTKKRTDRLYTLYLDTKNGVTTGYGTNLLSMAYTDSLNMFSAAYFIDYRALNDNRMNNTYAYPEKTNEYRGLPGSYNGQYHIGQLAYQRYQGKNLFNVKVEYRKSPGKQKYDQDLLGQTDDKGNLPVNSRRLKSDYASIAADLYYMYMFNQSRNLSVNVINTYYHSTSDNTLSSPTSGYSFENHIDNKSYSLIAEVLYGDKLWNGDFSLGAYYQYKNLDQEYNSAETPTVHTHKEYVYADYSNATGKLSYTVGLGLENNHYQTSTRESFNYFVVRPSLALNMQYNKCSAMRLTASVNTSVPNIGDLTNSIVTIDEHFYSQGNTGLKPCYSYYTNLSYQYASNDGKLYIAPSVSYSYYPGKNMPVLLTNADDVILRTSKIKDVQKFGASLSLSYKPIQWLVFQPYYNYEYSDYRTPNQSVAHSLHNAGVSVQFLPKNWQVVWNGNFPMTTVDGDLSTRMGFNMSASVLYKYKLMSVGLEYYYSPNPSRIYADAKDFSYSEETKWNNFKNLIAVKFTYYFYKGKSRNHAGKRLNNVDTDSGLTKANTAK